MTPTEELGRVLARVRLRLATEARAADATDDTGVSDVSDHSQVPATRSGAA